MNESFNEDHNTDSILKIDDHWLEWEDDDEGERVTPLDRAIDKLATIGDRDRGSIALFVHIIVQAINDGDEEFLQSRICDKYCKLIGIGVEQIIQLMNVEDDNRIDEIVIEARNKGVMRKSILARYKISPDTYQRIMETHKLKTSILTEDVHNLILNVRKDRFINKLTFAKLRKKYGKSYVILNIYVSDIGKEYLERVGIAEEYYNDITNTWNADSHRTER